MSANTSKEMPAKVAQTSKASTPRSTSSNAASTKATSSTPGTTLRHQPAAQDPNQALSQRLTGPSGNTLLRGIGAWADPPGPNAGATTDSAIGGDVSHQRNARELGPQSQPRSSNDQGLTPMERFRKEGRHDQPSGLLDGGKPQSEHGKGKSR